MLPSQSSVSAGLGSCWFLFRKVFKVNEWRARWRLFTASPPLSFDYILIVLIHIVLFSLFLSLALSDFIKKNDL